MGLLEDMLRDFKPSTWTTEEYKDKKFVRVPLESDDEKFVSVQTEFNNCYGNKYKVLNIERIQAPFLYFRFKLRQAYYEGRYQEPSESCKFVAITIDSDSDNMIGCNCDNRRNKIPEFLSDRLDLDDYKCDYVIVTKVIDCFNESERDSNTYPEYIIQFQKEATEINAESAASFSK